MQLEHWLDTWRAPLVGLLAAWGVPWSAAGELAQEVFAQAWLARERFRGDALDPRASGPWLRGIARNVHRGWAREQGRSARAVPIESAQLPAPGEEPPMEAAERLAPLRQALDRLEPELREVVYAHHLEETPLREVAALLGITERAVEGRLYRARAKLREQLERHEAAEARR